MKKLIFMLAFLAGAVFADVQVEANGNSVSITNETYRNWTFGGARIKGDKYTVSGSSGGYAWSILSPNPNSPNIITDIYRQNDFCCHTDRGEMQTYYVGGRPAIRPAAQRDAGEPEIGVERHAGIVHDLDLPDIREKFAVEGVYPSAAGDEPGQRYHLSAAYAGADVAQPVVVTYRFVMVVWSAFARLGRQK